MKEKLFNIAGKKETEPRLMYGRNVGHVKQKLARMGVINGWVDSSMGRIKVAHNIREWKGKF